MWCGPRLRRPAVVVDATSKNRSGALADSGAPFWNVESARRESYRAQAMPSGSARALAQML